MPSSSLRASDWLSDELARGRDEASAGRLGGQGVAMLVVFDAADADDDQGSNGNDVGAVLLPHLEQLLAPQFLVDFPG